MSPVALVGQGLNWGTVAPYAGAWIETRQVPFYLIADGWSLLARERGLKQIPCSHPNLFLMSLLTQESTESKNVEFTAFLDFLF